MHFDIRHASPSLREAAREHHATAWTPTADGGARLYDVHGHVTTVHRHLCTRCNVTVAYSDECESEYSHDYELCEQCSQEEGR